MKIYTDPEILDWCAEYLTSCQAIEDKRGEHCEIIGENVTKRGDHEMVIERAVCKTMKQAFREAVSKAIAKFPNRRRSKGAK